MTAYKFEVGTFLHRDSLYEIKSDVQSVFLARVAVHYSDISGEIVFVHEVRNYLVHIYIPVGKVAVFVVDKESAVFVIPIRKHFFLFHAFGVVVSVFVKLIIVRVVRYLRAEMEEKVTVYLR